MMTKLLILDFLRTHREEIRENFGVTKIGLFGSYVRNEQNADSDIDIAVEIESNNKFRSFFGLKYYLEDNLKHTIDLGVESTLKPIAKETIIKDIIYV